MLNMFFCVWENIRLFKNTNPPRFHKKSLWVTHHNTNVARQSYFCTFLVVEFTWQLVKSCEMSLFSSATTLIKWTAGRKSITVKVVHFKNSSGLSVSLSGNTASLLFSPSRVCTPLLWLNQSPQSTHPLESTKSNLFALKLSFPRICSACLSRREGTGASFSGFLLVGCTQTILPTVPGTPVCLWSHLSSQDVTWRYF